MTVLDWVKRRLSRSNRRGLWQWFTESERDQEVMPSHYASLVQPERGHYPGHCPNCGTDNDPGFTYCETCGSEIPRSDDFGRDCDLAAILGE